MNYLPLALAALAACFWAAFTEIKQAHSHHDRDEKAVFEANYEANYEDGYDHQSVSYSP